MNKILVTCEICSKEVLIPKYKINTFHTCGRTCMGIRNSKRYSKKVAKTCPVCNKIFKIKTSSNKRRMYCSKNCQANAYKTRYRGTDNPNYRPTHIDKGYTFSYKIGKVPLHRLVVLEFFGINKIPSELQVHHRDCDKRNNIPTNLVVLTNSDHRWLHKQYGNACLWAYTHNMVSKENLIAWSDNKEKANRVLDLNITNQSAVQKFREFGETPEVDNTEPSVESNLDEGVTTSSESLRDNNSTTSAGQKVISEDIV